MLVAAVLSAAHTTLLAVRRGLVLSHEVVTLLSNLVAALFYLVTMVCILLPLVRGAYLCESQTRCPTAVKRRFIADDGGMGG